MPKKAPKTIASKPKAKAGAASPQKAPSRRKSAETARPKKANHAGKGLPGPGRPHFYTQELADEICRRLAEGESLRSIARTSGFPAESRIREWSLDAAHPFAAQYARARATGYQKMADEILEIADDSNGDLIERADGVLTVDHEHIQRARLRVDTRKWILSKMLPKVYGDKFQVGGDGGAPLTFKLIPGDEKL